MEALWEITTPTTAVTSVNLESKLDVKAKLIARTSLNSESLQESQATDSWMWGCLIITLFIDLSKSLPREPYSHFLQKADPNVSLCWENCQVLWEVPVLWILLVPNLEGIRKFWHILHAWCLWGKNCYWSTKVICTTHSRVNCRAPSHHWQLAVRPQSWAEGLELRMLKCLTTCKAHVWS